VRNPPRIDPRLLGAGACFALAWLVVSRGIGAEDSRLVLFGGALLILTAAVFVVSGPSNRRKG
jgi:hypothetical protein